MLKLTPGQLQFLEDCIDKMMENKQDNKEGNDILGSPIILRYLTHLAFSITILTTKEVLL